MFPNRAVTLLVISAAFATGALGTSASKQQQAQALFDRACKVSNLEAQGSPPFMLDASISLYNNKGAEEEGGYLLTWKSKEEWKRQLSFSDYREITVRRGEEMWLYSSTQFVPFRMTTIFDALKTDFCPKMAIGFQATRVAPAKLLQGPPEQCVEGEDGRGLRHDYCFDGRTGALASDDERAGRAPRTEFEYSGYMQAGDKTYASKVQVSLGRQPLALVNLTEVRLNPSLRASSLATPSLPGVRRFPFCDEGSKDLLPPKATFHPEPPYPPREPLDGHVVLFVVVGADGRTKEMEVLGSSAPEFSASALGAVSKWKFRPAMCRGVPVDADVSVYVTFRH